MADTLVQPTPLKPRPFTSKRAAAFESYAVQLERFVLTNLRAVETELITSARQSAALLRECADMAQADDALWRPVKPPSIMPFKSKRAVALENWRYQIVKLAMIQVSRVEEALVERVEQADATIRQCASLADQNDAPPR